MTTPDSQAPVTAESVEGFPEQPLEEGVNPISDLSAHVAVLARKPKASAADHAESRKEAPHGHS